MECSQHIKPVGDEMVFPLEGEAEIGVQCYQQLEKFFWRVELRVDGEVLQAKMFLNSSDARSFARELQELLYRRIVTLEVSEQILI